MDSAGFNRYSSVYYIINTILYDNSKSHNCIKAPL